MIRTIPSTALSAVFVFSFVAACNPVIVVPLGSPPGT